MGESWRCFVAVGIPDEVRGEVEAFLAGEAAQVRGVRWASRGQLHLTLKFLGGVEAERVQQLCTALDGAVAGFPEFSAQLRGAGAFPSPQRPRVVWAGVAAGAAELTALAAAVEGGLAPLGFPAEGRAFAPHLTLGRLREPPGDPAPLRRLLDGARDRAWGGPFRVPGVHLVRSRLLPAGAVYNNLHVSPLAGEPGAERSHE